MAGGIVEQLKTEEKLAEELFGQEYRGTEGQNNFCRDLWNFLFISFSVKFHLKIIEASSNVLFEILCNFL